MNDLIRFEFKGREVRTTVINGDPWWVLKDVCDILGIGNSRDVVSRLDDDQKGVDQIDTLGGKQNLTIINESGLYSVILRSDKPEAKTFRKWVTSEVLPQIRRTGSYLPAMPKTLPEALRAYANEVERREQIEQQLAEAAPKIDFYNAVSDSPDAVPMHKVAKMLEMGMGRNQLFAFLREKRVLMGDNTPYQEYADRGYFSVKEKHWKDGGGTPHVAMSTYVYQKGIEFIRNLILEENTEKYHRRGRAFRGGFHISRTLF